MTDIYLSLNVSSRAEAQSAADEFNRNMQEWGRTNLATVVMLSDEFKKQMASAKSYHAAGHGLKITSDQPLMVMQLERSFEGVNMAQLVPSEFVQG